MLLLLLSSLLLVEKGVKSCELLLSPSSELIVTSLRSSSSSSSSSPAAAAAVDRVPVNTTVDVACRNSSLVLSGSSQLTCQQNGSWDHALPTCQCTPAVLAYRSNSAKTKLKKDHRSFLPLPAFPNFAVWESQKYYKCSENFKIIRQAFATTCGAAGFIRS